MSEKGGSRDGAEQGAERESDESVVESQPFIDGVFDVLSDWRRREICQFFIDTDADTATVSELAILVAGCRPASASNASHGELVTDLKERHLPRLDAAGVVDFDSRSGTVRYWGQPTVEKWLEHVAAVDRRVD
jgi:hypothetical protein